MTQNTLLTFLPLFLAQHLHYSLAKIGFAIFILQVFGFMAAPISGTLSDRLGRKRIINISMLMTAIILVTMAVARNSGFFIFFIATLGSFLYATRPVIQAWLMETTPPKMAGTCTGILFGVRISGLQWRR